MTFTELLTVLEGRNVLSATRVKDYRTSLRYLAQALGYDSPDACPVDETCKDTTTWAAALEAHWHTLDATRALAPPHAKTKPVGASTRRNTRSDLAKIFRLAEQHGLLAVPLPVPLLARRNRRDLVRELQATSPYQRTLSSKRKQPYGLRQAQWPPDVQAGWQQYHDIASDSIRPRTLEGYANNLESYFGYVAHIVGRPPVWDDLFAVRQLRGFVRWHAARMGRPLTGHARQLVILAAVAAKVLQLAPERVRALRDYCNELPIAPRMHPKRPFEITLATVDRVGDEWLRAGRVPVTSDRRAHYPGAVQACLFQRGLLLKILVRAPLRQRNLREMRLDHNLYEDPETGHWHLRFVGPELKIERRGMEFNEYAKDLTEDAPDLVPLLKEWLTVFRPRLPNATTSDLCFLTRNGRPFSDSTLGKELAYAVKSCTGKEFYPHLVRSMVANEAIRAGAEPGTVAVILGDTLKTTMMTYYSVDPKTHHALGARILQKVIQPNTGASGAAATAD
jgi:hypothetical protein